MRTLLATVAAGALLGTAGIAQDATDGSIYTVAEGDHYASNLIGSRLYTTEGELGEQVEYSTVSQSWNDVGEINDFVVGEDGSVQAVIVGVGGFLGIGEKDVAVSWNDVSATYDESGSRFLVVPMSQEELENAPAFEYQGVEAEMGGATAMDGAATEAPPATALVEGEVATSDAAEAEEEQQAASEMGETETNITEASEAATEVAQAEATDQDAQSTPTALADGGISEDLAATDDPEASGMTPEGYELVAVDQVTVEQLEGATVRSASSDQWVGEISTLLIDDQGKITEAVVDVGGFLGIGEKPVAMNFDQLEIYRQGEGGTLEVNVMATREELEGMQAYEDG